MDIHPFDPLVPAEITAAAGVVNNDFHGCGSIKFRVITLKEPPKREMVRFLEQVDSGQTAVFWPARTAHVQVIQTDKDRKNCLVELLVDLDKTQVVKKQYLPGKHSYIDSDYMQAVKAVCRADSRFQAEVRSLDLPEDATVIIEPWAYAPDGMNDMSQRVSMCWFYMRLSSNADANYYAYPLDVCAEVSEELKVTKVFRLPSSNGNDIHDKTFDRREIHSTASSEYYPDLRPPPRNTTKPYHVNQPEVSNYEYIFAFHLGQDASINYEVRVTGIMSTSPINVGEKAPYGTVVTPGVLAPYH
ncbi:amine oxidase [Aspergillus sp. HF37]|nr:amine oxidase [Aspergillus sp. HF37]